MFQAANKFFLPSCEFLKPCVDIGWFLLGISQQECSTESHLENQFVLLVWFKFIEKMQS